MLVVWEPILPTDWRSPGTAALARLSDGRVRQFWDPEHLIATALSERAKLKPPQPAPKCCVQRGFDWDQAILYPAEARWGEAPATLFWDGPVVKVISGVGKSLSEQR